MHDIGTFDENGFLYVNGRSDDEMNIAGHKVSSSEIESTVLCLEEINECCAVGLQDSIIGMRLILFISITKKIDDINTKNLYAKIKSKIDSEITKYHIPSEIYIFNNLAKTKSGKIMRRIMRNIAETFSINTSDDISTIIDKTKFFQSRNTFFNNYINSHTNEFFIIQDQLLSSSKNLICFLIEKILRISKAEEINNLYIVYDQNQKIKNFSIKIKSNDSLIDIYKIINENIGETFKCKKIALTFIFSSTPKTRILLKCGPKKIYYHVEDLFFSDFSRNLKLQINKELSNLIKQTRPKNLKEKCEIENNFICYKCRLSLEKIIQDRGNSAYLVQCIDSKNKNKFICDLCLSGW